MNIRSIYDNIVTNILLDVNLSTTATTSAVVDTKGHNTAMISIRASAAAGSPSASSVAATLQESSDLVTWNTANDVGGTAITATATNTSAIAQASARVESLNGNRKRYLRLVLTPTITGGTNPVFTTSALIVLDRSYQAPTNTTVSNT